MKFFGVHLSDLESDRFAQATYDQVGMWVFLHALCTKLRNSGVLEGARNMSARYWGRHGIDPAILAAESPLWSWQGDDLVLHAYDHEGQKLAEKKSEGGKAGAMKRWNRASAATAESAPDGPAESTADRTPITTPDGSPDAPNQYLTVPVPHTTFSVPDRVRSSRPSRDRMRPPAPPVRAEGVISWSPSEGFQGIRDDDLDRWAAAYPAADMPGELARASEWLRSNPTKRKAVMRRFITGWLSRAQDRGSDPGGGHAHATSQPAEGRGW